MQELFEDGYRYRIEFSGSCAIDKEPETVMKQFALLFQVPEEHIQGIFQGKDIFVKENLTVFSLKQFTQTFNAIGVVYTVSRIPNAQKADGGPLQARNAEKIKWAFKCGIILYVILSFTDTILQNRAVDFGYLPYLLGTIPFVYGGIYYVGGKGYHPRLCLLGLLSMFGLAILLLLPDRTRDQSGFRLNKSSLAAFLILGVSLYWTVGHIKQTLAVSKYINKADIQHMNRDASLNLELIESPSFLQEETTKLKCYFRDGLELIIENDFRPDTEGRISRMMFHEVYDFFTWIDLQRFLYSQQSKEARNHLLIPRPYFLDAQQTKDIRKHLLRPNLRKLRHEFSGQLRELLSTYPDIYSHLRFVQEFQRWIMQCHHFDLLTGQCLNPVDLLTGKGGKAETDELYSYLSAVHHAYVDHLESSLTGKPKQIIAPPSQLIQSAVFENDNLIHFIFSGNLTKELQGKHLYMAFFSWPHRSSGQRFIHLYEFTCVGGDLPAYYLKRNYSILPELRQISHSINNAYDPEFKIKQLLIQLFIDLFH